MSKKGIIEYSEAIGAIVGWIVYRNMHSFILQYLPYADRAALGLGNLGITYGLTAFVLIGYAAGRVYKKING